MSTDQDPALQPLVDALLVRALGDGGFASHAGGAYAPEATAWAVLALVAAGAGPEQVPAARARLAAGQAADGRVSLDAEHPEAFWVTPLAALAWHGAPRQAAAASRAVGFLLATTGRHWPKAPGAATGHDPALRGWPWIEDTHSFVEPTALALLALRRAGQGAHERAREAARMLLDRQLPRGGWNYGNTTVYGQELRPAAVETGVALAALAGLTTQAEVLRSLAFARAEAARLRTPLSLAWALLGLGAWGERPAAARSWVLESAAAQPRRGAYPTTLLALLLLAAVGDAAVARVLPR
ncbi:MAG: hypothetical protein HY906_25970 [Deltaproteobacteria bacterium]|nr:hypothetical protein [Deltaproteobacteria bacterium]